MNLSATFRVTGVTLIGATRGKRTLFSVL